MLTIMSKTVSSTTQSTLLRDLFTDTDGTNLTAHTMNTGPGWTQLNGAWTVQSNRARPPAATANSINTSDAGKAGITATLDVVIPGGVVQMAAGLSIRVSDANNGWVCIIENDAAQFYIAISERVAGTNTTRASANFVADPSGTTITLTVVASGNTITLTASTGESCNYGSASSNSSVTNHGVYSYTAASYVVTDLDNFLVTG